MFRNSRSLDCFLDRFLNHRLIQMVAALSAGLSVKILTTCRKHELPSPLGIHVGIFASNRIRQFRPPRAVAQIFFMNALGVLQMLDQILLRAGGQHGHPVLLPPLSAQWAGFSDASPARKTPFSQAVIGALPDKGKPRRLALDSALMRSLLFRQVD